MMNLMRQANADRWCCVFSDLTVVDDGLESFYGKPHCLPNSLGEFVSMGFAAGVLKADDSYTDCYQYFRVPE